MKYRLEENRRLRDALIIAFMIGVAAGALIILFLCRVGLLD
jgi:hypothetical protein